MLKENNTPKTTEPSNKKSKQDDILNIAEQFVRYFEKVDRGEKNGNSIHNS